MLRLLANVHRLGWGVETARLARTMAEEAEAPR
jgi:hypothetical protein